MVSHINHKIGSLCFFTYYTFNFSNSNYWMRKRAFPVSMRGDRGD